MGNACKCDFNNLDDYDSEMLVVPHQIAGHFSATNRRILTHTVGVNSVKGSRLSANFGEGFAAIPSSIGVIVVGGSR
jgi:hypothetical protein